MSDKREDYISWDEYFMGVAMLSGMRSKDPNTQVGCCIVSQDNKILSMGYNGLPMGCSDDEFPWAREGEDPLETKYVYTINEFVGVSEELPNPYGKPLTAYGECFEILTGLIDKLADKLNSYAKGEE